MTATDLYEAPIPEELIREVITTLLTRAEDCRREPQTLDATPIAGLFDYAASGQAIASAMHHLDEALPTGQKCRAEAAYIALAIGAIELGKWLTAKGYNVNVEDQEL